MRPLLSMLLACSPGPDAPDADDRARYARLLADEARPPRAVLADCAGIRHAGLRGDCQLAALGRADRADTGDLADWCADVDRGMAREECWFVVAERRRRTGDAAGAAAACGESGRFQEDCARHLWEDSVVALAARTPPPTWPGGLPPVAAEIEAWAARLPGLPDLPDQMWTRFYERALARPNARLDLSDCRALDKPDARRCHAAGAALYGRRLARRADAAGVDLCARAARAGAWQELVPAAAHPRLDAVIADLQAERCPPG